MSGGTSPSVSLDQLVRPTYAHGDFPFTDFHILDNSVAIAVPVAKADLNNDARCFSHFAQTNIAKAKEIALHVLISQANVIRQKFSEQSKPMISVFIEILNETLNKILKKKKKPAAYRVWVFCSLGKLAWKTGKHLQEIIDGNENRILTAEGLTKPRSAAGAGGGQVDVEMAGEDDDGEGEGGGAGGGGGGNQQQHRGGRGRKGKGKKTGRTPQLDSLVNIDKWANIMQIRNVLSYDQQASENKNAHPDLDSPQNPLNPQICLGPEHAMNVVGVCPEQNNLSNYLFKTRALRDRRVNIGSAPSLGGIGGGSREREYREEEEEEKKHDGYSYIYGESDGDAEGTFWAFPDPESVYRIPDAERMLSQFLKIELRDPSIEVKRDPNEFKNFKQQAIAIKQGKRNLEECEKKLDKLDISDEQSIAQLFDTSLPTNFGSGESTTAQALFRINTEARNKILANIRAMRADPAKHYTPQQIQAAYETQMKAFESQAIATFNHCIWNEFGNNSPALKAACKWLSEYLATHNDSIFVEFPKLSSDLSYFQDYVVHYLNQIEMVFKGKHKGVPPLTLPGGCKWARAPYCILTLVFSKFVMFFCSDFRFNLSRGGMDRFLGHVKLFRSQSQRKTTYFAIGCCCRFQIVLFRSIGYFQRTQYCRTVYVQEYEGRCCK